MWTYDNSTYNLTESTNLDPNIGTVTQELNGNVKELTKDPEQIPASLVLANMVASLCNNSNVVMEEGKYKPLGDSTEVLFFYLRSLC